MKEVRVVGCLVNGLLSTASVTYHHGYRLRGLSSLSVAPSCLRSEISEEVTTRFANNTSQQPPIFHRVYTQNPKTWINRPRDI